MAYLLTTSLDAALLPTSFDSLVDLYLEELSTRLAEKSVKVDVESMRKEFNVVWLDYTRVIVSRYACLIAILPVLLRKGSMAQHSVHLCYMYSLLFLIGLPP